MGRIAFCITILLAAALMLWVGPTVAQEERTAASPREYKQVDEATQRWMDAAMPGEPHRVLDRFIGLWNVTTRMWMEGPGSEPSETTGIVTCEWILKSHYVRQETRGMMMGIPFEGWAITGYDNLKKQYVGIWIDSVSTGIYTLSGHLDPTGTVLTMYGEVDDPMTGEFGKINKYVTRFIDEDHLVFEIHDPSRGENTKVVEMDYRRK